MTLRSLFGRRPAPVPAPSPLALPPPVVAWAPAPLLPDPAGGDALLQAALELAPRRRCLLAWGDGPRVARMSLALRAAGALATEVVAPVPGNADSLLLDAGDRLGLRDEALRLLRRAPAQGRGAPPAGAEDCDAPSPWWRHGALDARGATRAGLVVDGSQLIHWPDPLERLRALAATGARHVVLETPLLGPDAALAQAGFASGDIWYAVGMTPERSAAIAAHWRSRGVSLPQYELMPHGFSLQQAQEAGLSSTAWWSFTDLAGLRRLLGMAGLAPLRHREVWDGRAVVMVAERVRPA